MTVPARAARDPDPACADGDCGGASGDADRLGDGVGGGVDPLDAVLERHGDPHAARADRDGADALPDRDRGDDLVRARVDPRHGPVSAVADPDGARADHDGARAVADRDRRDGPLRPRIQPRDPAARAGDGPDRVLPHRDRSRDHGPPDPQRARDAVELRVDHPHDSAPAVRDPQAALPDRQPVDGDARGDGVGNAPRARPDLADGPVRDVGDPDRAAADGEIGGPHADRHLGEDLPVVGVEDRDAVRANLHVALAARHGERGRGRGRDSDGRRRREHGGMPPARGARRGRPTLAPTSKRR